MTHFGRKHDVVTYEGWKAKIFARADLSYATFTQPGNFCCVQAQ
jgi:hypothetical protein